MVEHDVCDFDVVPPKSEWVSLETPTDPLSVLKARIREVKEDVWGIKSYSHHYSGPVYSLVLKACNKRRRKSPEYEVQPYVKPKDRVYGDRERKLMHEAIDKLISERGLNFNGAGHCNKDTITDILKDIYKNEEGQANKAYNSRLTNKAAPNVTEKLRLHILDQLDVILCNPENAIAKLRALKDPATFTDFIEEALDGALAS